MTSERLAGWDVGTMQALRRKRMHLDADLMGALDDQRVNRAWADSGDSGARHRLSLLEAITETAQQRLAAFDAEHPELLTCRDMEREARARWWLGGWMDD